MSTALERSDAPAPSKLVAAADYDRMRSSLTALIGLGFALRASVSDDELRTMVAEAVTRTLGVSP